MKKINCSCSHDYQDKKLGKGKRWANATTKDKSGNSSRCTVCGKDA